MELGDDLGDDVVILRAWSVDDAGWYADSIQDAEVQRFTIDPPTLTAADVAAAINALPGQPEQVARLITDAATGERLGNIALTCRDGVGDVSYWVAVGARGRGVGTPCPDADQRRRPHAAAPTRAPAVDPRGGHRLPARRRAGRLPPRP